MSRQMKDSGIEWIGEIPVEWDICKFKTVIESTNAGEVIDKGYWNDGEELLYTCQKTPMMSNYSDFPDRKRTTDRDLLLTRNATPYIFIPQINSIYSNVVQRVVVKKEFSLRYLAYAALKGAEALTVNGDTIPSYNMEVWKNIYIPWISKNVQEEIADYLDQQCALIETVIEKTKASIEEYKKLKQAVITQAVTKGVRGERTMQETGYRWVQEIPLEWRLIPSRYLFSNSDMKRVDGDEQLTASQKHGIITQKKYMELEDSKVVLANKGLDDWKHVEPNDFVISLRSFQGGLEMSEISGCITWHYIVLKPRRKIYSNYFKWLFKSELYINALQRTCNYIRDGQDLRYSNFVQVPLFEPSLAEQKEIAEYLDVKCNEIDSIVSKREKYIGLLEAYKKSLIYEYVTGKKEVPVT